MRYFWFSVTVLMFIGRVVLAGTGHAYMPASAFHLYPSSVATLTNTGGSDPKIVWSFPSNSIDIGAVLGEFWYPDSALTNSFNITLTFRGNSTDVTKSACWLASYAVTLVNGDWGENLGGGADSPYLGTQAMGNMANKDQKLTLTGGLALDDANHTVDCTATSCKNSHGQIFIMRQIVVNCLNEVPVALELEGVDVYWTTP